MATPIKQIKTSDNTLHDIMADEYIVGTQTSATNMWKGVSESNSLYAGKVINYKLPFAGSTNTNTHTGLTTNTTLELTLADGSTVVYPVYRNASTAITTHYPVNSIVRLVFDPTSVTLNGHTFEGSWKTADYDANTTTTVQQSSTTTNGYLPLILKATTATSTVTTSVRFNSNLTGNPSTGDIKLKSTTIKPTSTTANTINLPTSSGTLALTSDIPTTLPPTAHTHSIGEVYNGTSALSINSSASNVKMDGTASAGSGSALALANHVHPTDTSRAPLASPAFTGNPTAPTPTTTLGIANKGYVDSALGGITQVEYSVTTTLPTTGVKGTVYLVSHEHDASQNDYYDEYIYANNAWEKIGHTDVDLSNYIEVIDVGDLAVADSSTFASDLFINGYAYATTTISSELRTEILNKFHNNACAIKGTIASFNPFLLLNEGTHDYNSAYEYKVFSGTTQFHLNNILHSYVVNVNISTNTAAPDFITIMALANEYELEEKIGYNDLSITPTLNSGTEIATITAVQNGVDVIAATLYVPSTAATPTNDLDIANKIYVDGAIEGVSEIGPEDYVTFTLGASTTLPAMAGTLPIYPIICEDTDITSFTDFDSLPVSKKNKITVYIPGENDDYARHVFYLQNHSSDMDGNVYWYTSAPDNKIDSSYGSVHSNTHIIMISNFVEYVTSNAYYGALVKEDYQKDVQDLTVGISNFILGDISAYVSATANYNTGVTIGTVNVSGANAATFYVPEATNLSPGVTTVGNINGTGAAGYSHIHYLHKDSFVQSYPGSFTNIYPAANVTAVTGITSTVTNVLSSVTGTTFGISVSNGVLEIGSTIGISSLSPATTSVVRTVTASGSSSVRGTSISLMTGLGTAVTSLAVTSVNNAYEPEQNV